MMPIITNYNFTRKKVNEKNFFEFLDANNKKKGENRLQGCDF